MRINRDSTAGSIIELVVVVGAAVGIAFLVQLFLVKPYRIPSESMVPTLQVGQRVLVNRIGHRLGDPSIGDVIVFNPPVGADDPVNPKCGNPGQGPEYYPGPKSHFPCAKPIDKKSDNTFVKRVVAGPGDTISVNGGIAVVNGKQETGNYIQACGGGNACDLRTIVIPAGHWFMMGDNRGNSLDSRFWGPIPTSWIIGRAFATYWPPSRIGLL